MGKLPLDQYFASLSYLSLLLITSFLFLPRSTTWLLGPSYAPRQRSSADRPEHAFLTQITAQPLLTLMWTCLGMLICMAWWGRKLRGWWGSQQKKQIGHHSDLGRVKESFLATMIATVILAPLLMALGAPLDEYFGHTVLLAAHIALLVVWPVTHAVGLPSIYEGGTVQRYQLTRLFCEFRPDTPLERALAFPAFGAVCGTWLGAVPIALDWDRPWQNYPLTLVFGAIAGFIAGGWLSFARTGYEQLGREVSGKHA